jgi:D-lyxose ketol-isomerase
VKKTTHLKKYGQMMLTTAALAAALLIGVDSSAADSVKTPTVKGMKKVKLPKYKNEDFYKDGKFQVEKAKQAYFDMMAAYSYPVPEFLRTNMWATDFGLGDFVHVGMAGIFWINDEKQGYFAHEIYLLPGQMIVEHGHEATAKGKAKMESWHVRNGSIYTFGEEGGPIPAGVSLPKSQEKFITVSKCYEMQPGDIRTLNRVTAKHFMMGGPQGAIVSEYATFHDGDGLRFTNPGVKF